MFGLFVWSSEGLTLIAADESIIALGELKRLTGQGFIRPLS